MEEREDFKEIMTDLVRQRDLGPDISVDTAEDRLQLSRR